MKQKINQSLKKTILFFAAIVLTGLGAFAANGGDEVGQPVTNAFHKDFANARNISWEQQKDYAKVTFTLNEHVLFACYTNNGDLHAVVSNILSDQLPISLMTGLNKAYSGYWISELYERASDNQTTYYATLQNADQTVTLKSDGTNTWSQVSSINKDAEQE